MKLSRSYKFCAGTIAGGLLLPVTAWAQDATLETRLKTMESATGSAQSAGDNAWVMVCTALVLMMTGPGLALFYAGLVRNKNVLGTMAQSFVLMALVTVLWAVYGYSLAFATGTAFIGGLDFAFLRGVGSEANASYAATIPQQTFMLFQLMFAVITPAILLGAWAERIKFKAVIAFTVLWTTIVYFPLAHMVWGAGGFLNAALGGTVPALDFAGGTVVHISSGVSALVGALYLGKRVGYGEAPMKPHNLVLSIIGACLLWVGWFGFNAGSALAASPLAASAFTATHLAAASAALGWMLAEWKRTGQPTTVGLISGAVAGLVGITPASGFVTPMPALLIGFIAGLGCYFMVAVAKERLGYDDSLDVFGIHGVGGIIGALLTGVFATKAVNPIFKDAAGNALPVGLLEGNTAQPGRQAFAVLFTVALAALGSYVILKVVDIVIGLRVSTDEEVKGLDLSQHGEVGYLLEGDLGASFASFGDLLGAETSLEVAAPAVSGD